MLTSDQTARSHPALDLGVITAALSKLQPGRGRQLECGCSGTALAGAPRRSWIFSPRRFRRFWSPPPGLLGRWVEKKQLCFPWGCSPCSFPAGAGFIFHFSRRARPEHCLPNQTAGQADLHLVSWQEEMSEAKCSAYVRAPRAAFPAPPQPAIRSGGRVSSELEAALNPEQSRGERACCRRGDGFAPAIKS